MIRKLTKMGYMKKFVLLSLLLCWWSVGMSNNVRIAGDVRVVAADVNATTGVATVKLRLQWDNSWRDAFNYDAVYLFLKYKVDLPSERWHHAYLMDAGHVLPEGFEYSMSKSVTTANRNEGIFISRSVKGFGSVDLDIQLQWNINGNPDRKIDRPMFNQGQIFTSAMGIEMVYVPRGAFRAGDTESNKTFYTKDVVFPPKYDVMGTDAVDTCFSSTYSAANPPEFATNRMDDLNNGSPYPNAWVGSSSRQHTDYHDFFQVDFENQMDIKCMAIESISGRTPVAWRLQGYNTSSNNWIDLYSGTGADWATGSRQAYPCTRTIRVYDPDRSSVTRYSQYRVLIDSMANSNVPPVIKNISMSDHDIFSDMDNSVLIADSLVKMDNRYGLYAYDEDSTKWSGNLHVDYPSGYGAFFAMKYETSQEQYVAFLNKLEAAQQRARTIGAALTALKTGQYVFGPRKTVPAARNGIKLAEIGVQEAPYVFVCDLDPDTEYSQDGDGQTIACNFLNAGDMLAYADWCGLRPLSELEFEKMSRRPYPASALRGEYAWNTNGDFQAATTIEGATAGRRTEKTASGNVNATGALSGPLRSGIFASDGSSQSMSGATFWGVMDLSGNLSGIYYNVNTEGRLFRGRLAGNHGNGVINATGATDISNLIWPREPKAFSLKGGNYRDVADLTRISDRSRNIGVFATLDEAEELRDSTMTFRLGRTARIQTLKAEVTLENGQTSATSGVVDYVCSGDDYTISGSVPAEITGAYEIAWFISSDNGANWNVIEGESGPSITLNSMRNINAPEDVFQKYQYKRKIFSNQMEVLQSYPVSVWVINHTMQLSGLIDTVDVYDYSQGIRVQVPQTATFAWTWIAEERPIEPEYVIKAGKTQKHYFKYIDFSIDGTLGDVQDDQVQKVLLEVTVLEKCVFRDTVRVFVQPMPKRNNVVEAGSGAINTAFKCGDLLVDNEERTDNARAYRTIEIGDRCWFADNLNRNSSTYITGTKSRLCYNGTEANCDKYGSLYNFYAATQTTATTAVTEGVKGICPKGWHLPTNTEWIELYQVWLPTMTASTPSANGDAVQSTLNDWTYSSEANIGTNRQRFSALPGGGYFYSYSGTYSTRAGINARSGYGDIGSRGWWWTSSTTGATYAYYYATDNSYIARYTPYYIRMDNNGNTYFNVYTASSTYGYFSNTIFSSTAHYYILTPNNNETTALTAMKTNFYMSVRCIQDKSVTE